MNISIIGTGRVGLITGAIFSKLNHNVTCVNTHSKQDNSIECKFLKDAIKKSGLALQEKTFRNICLIKVLAGN